MINNKDKKIPISLINMSNIYLQQQNFMEFLNRFADRHCLVDASNITGTDCYCDDLALQQLTKLLAEISVYGIHYIDGGNYHYLSKIFTDKLKQSFDLIVFDHHHDMQLPLFGQILSCGGWIKEMLDNNTFLNQVIIIGVQDELITEDIRTQYTQVQFITENEIIALFENVSNDVNKDSVLLDKKNLLLNQKVIKYIFDKIHIQYPVYISIDKDVLSKEQYKTNWDQGILSIECLKCLLSLITKHYQVLGIDICGEMDKVMQEQYGYKWNKVNGQFNIDLLTLLDSFDIESSIQN